MTQPPLPVLDVTHAYELEAGAFSLLRLMHMSGGYGGIERIRLVILILILIFLIFYSTSQVGWFCIISWLRVRVRSDDLPLPAALCTGV